MSGNIVPTLFEQHLQHIFSAICLIAILAPHIMVWLKMRRKVAIAIQIAIETALVIPMVTLIVISNPAFWNVFVFVWAVHFPLLAPGIRRIKRLPDQPKNVIN